MTDTTKNATSEPTVRRSVRFEYRKKPLPEVAALVAEARRIYAYDESARGLVWREHKNPKRPWPPLGTVVGGDDGHGYRMCLVLGHKFKVHQAVWMIQRGEFPQQAMDHINGDRRDNRMENLRLASDLENGQNRLSCLRPTSGVKKATKGPNYHAVVQHKGKKVYLGSFATKEQANAAYIDGKRLICGEFSPV